MMYQIPAQREGVLNMDTELKKDAAEECQNMTSSDDRDPHGKDGQATGGKSFGQKLFELMLAPGVVAMSIATRKNRHYQQKKEK